MVCGCWIKAIGSNAAPALPAPNEPTPSIFLLLFRLWAVGRGRRAHTRARARTHTHQCPSETYAISGSVYYIVSTVTSTDDISSSAGRPNFIEPGLNFTNNWNILGKHAEYVVKETVLFEDNSCITKTLKMYMTFFLQWNTKEDSLKWHIMKVNRDTK